MKGILKQYAVATALNSIKFDRFLKLPFVIWYYPCPSPLSLLIKMLQVQ